MNYLILSSLHHYSMTTGPHQQLAADIYKELRWVYHPCDLTSHDLNRSNLIENMLWQYKQTGYIWEQYDDDYGGGKVRELLAIFIAHMILWCRVHTPSQVGHH